MVDTHLGLLKCAFAIVVLGSWSFFETVFDVMDPEPQEIVYNVSTHAKTSH